MLYLHILKILLLIKFLGISIEVIYCIVNIDQVIIFCSLFCFTFLFIMGCETIDKIFFYYVTLLNEHVDYICRYILKRYWAVKKILPQFIFRAKKINKFFVFLFLFLSNSYYNMKNNIIFFLDMYTYVNLILNFFKKNLKITYRLKKNSYNKKLILFS
jgi:hypothetical protein